MRFTFQIIAATLQTASIVSAGWTDGLCSTKLGVSSVKNVPTSTKTIGLPLTAFVKACASTTKTITPKAQTTTLTDTLTSTITTTAPQSTDTVLTTSTDTMTSTELFSTTIITTSTATSTVVTTGTVIVPTPAGFTPAASDASYRAKKRDIPERFTLVQRANSKSVQTLTFGTDKKLSFSLAVYPQAVNCVKIQKDVKTKTITIPFCTKTKTTTLAPSTSTIRETVSTLTTKTEDQPAAIATSTAYTTVTEIDSSTSTLFNTVTVTETQTSEAPAATSLAACASNNIVSSANGGQGIGQIRFGTNGFVSVPGATPYDCCVACQQTANCIGSASSTTGFCYVLIASTCSPDQTSGTEYRTSSSAQAGAALFVSNGACGRIPNGGGSS